MSMAIKQLRTFLSKRLDSLLSIPHVWGSNEAVELQTLQLLDLMFAIERPHEKRERVIFDSYNYFISERYPSAPPTLLHVILRDNDQSEQFLSVLSEFREHVETNITHENPYSNYELVFCIRLEEDVEHPSATRIGSYYDSFHHAVRASARATGHNRRLTSEMEQASNFVLVGDIDVRSRNGSPAKIIMPLAFPELEQTTMSNTSSPKKRVENALQDLINVAQWAKSTKSSLQHLKSLIPDMSRRSSLAQQVFRILPSPKSEVDAVEIGGKALRIKTGDHITLEKSIRPKIMEAIVDAKVSSPYRTTGRVRSFDLDHNHFTLALPNRKRISCWTTDDSLMMDVKENIDKEITVEGESLLDAGKTSYLIEKADIA